MTPSRPRLVLFDLDGTLVDTAPDLIDALNAAGGEYGFAPCPPERLRALVGLGSVALLAEAFGVDPLSARTQRMRARFLAHYARLNGRRGRLFDGIETLLRRLHGCGVHWGVVTNKPHTLAATLLQRLELPPGCVAVIGAGAPARAKPHPSGLWLAASLAGVDVGAAWYVGDDERDVVAAHGCPMWCVAALWGYVRPGTDPNAWGADASAASPAEVETLFDGSN